MARSVFNQYPSSEDNTYNFFFQKRELSTNMATSAGSSQCIKCGKDEAITKCAGCQQGFCFIHLEEHRQELKKQLNEIEVDQNLFRAKFHDKISQFGEDEDDPLIKKINQWEKNSIKKIQRTARKIKEKFFNDRHEDFNLIENSLKKLTEELNSRRKKDVIVENNLERWKKELAKLTEQLNKPPNATIQRTSTPLIYDIDLDISSKLISFRFSILRKISYRSTTLSSLNLIDSSILHIKFERRTNLKNFLDEDSSIEISNKAIKVVSINENCFLNPLLLWLNLTT